MLLRSNCGREFLCFGGNGVYRLHGGCIAALLPVMDGSPGFGRAMAFCELGRYQKLGFRTVLIQFSHLFGKQIRSANFASASFC